MTKKQKSDLFKEIKRLVNRSYEDDGNSYELEFRSELEKIIDVWDNLSEPTGKEKFKTKIIFGEAASNCACYDGENTAIRRINRGALDGSIKTYRLDTEHDRKVLFNALGDFDGWNGWWVCEE